MAEVSVKPTIDFQCSRRSHMLLFQSLFCEKSVAGRQSLLRLDLLLEPRREQTEKGKGDAWLHLHRGPSLPLINMISALDVRRSRLSPLVP